MCLESNHSPDWSCVIPIVVNKRRLLFPPDVISIDKTGEHFRLIYDVKGRFTVHRITAEEAKVRATVERSGRQQKLAIPANQRF